MGAPTRADKPKGSLGTAAARANMAVRPCQQRNMGSFRRAAKEEAVDD